MTQLLITSVSMDGLTDKVICKCHFTQKNKKIKTRLSLIVVMAAAVADGVGPAEPLQQPPTPAAATLSGLARLGQTLL